MINAFRRWCIACRVRNELHSLGARALDDMGIAPYQIEGIAWEEARRRVK